MKKIKKGKISYNNKGTAMMVAIIVIAVVMIFTFSLMLVTYTLYASQSKKAASLRNKEAANSLSLAIREELQSPEAYKNSALWRYLRCNIYQSATWPYYKKDVENHTSEYAFRYFDLKKNANYNIDGFPGSIKLCMYWCIPEDTVVSDDEELSQLAINRKKDSYLFIEVICNTGGQTYSIKDKYKMQINSFAENNPDHENEKNIISSLEADTKYNPMRLNINENEKWEFIYESN